LLETGVLHILLPMRARVPVRTWKRGDARGREAMRKVIAIVTVLLCGAAFAACAEKATDGEIQEMCKHLSKLGGEYDVTPIEIRTAKVEADYGNRVKHIETERETALKAIDTDAQTKLADLKKDDEKAKLKVDTDAAKAAKTAEFQTQIEKVNVDKVDAIKNVEQKAKDDAVAEKQSIEKCVAENKGPGIDKKIAQCRILTTTVDDYWKCK
jgi:hypothetical protein